MKLIWSPEFASKAYIDTVKFCEVHQASGVAELISAMAAGWSATRIVETWSQGGVILTSIGLSIAARHTGARHVCIVPDEHSRSDYVHEMTSTSSSVTLPEILVGDAEELMHEIDDMDFLVVDSRRRDFTKFIRLARLSQKGAVLVCKNASRKTTSSSGFKWRGVLEGGRKVVRTAYLPVGEGLDMAHVAASSSLPSSNNSSKVINNKRRWIMHFDHNSGEEHVIRTA